MPKIIKLTTEATEVRRDDLKRQDPNNWYNPMELPRSNSQVYPDDPDYAQQVKATDLKANHAGVHVGQSPLQTMGHAFGAGLSRVMQPVTNVAAMGADAVGAKDAAKNLRGFADSHAQAVQQYAKDKANPLNGVNPDAVARYQARQGMKREAEIYNTDMQERDKANRMTMQPGTTGAVVAHGKTTDPKSTSASSTAPVVPTPDAAKSSGFKMPNIGLPNITNKQLAGAAIGGVGLVAGAAIVGAIMNRVKQRNEWKTQGCNNITDPEQRRNCLTYVSQQSVQELEDSKGQCAKSNNPQMCVQHIQQQIDSMLSRKTDVQANSYKYLY